MSTPFTLLSASLSDGPALVLTQHLGFASDAFTRASFPHVPLETKVQDSIARWPANFQAPGAIYMKTVNEATGEIVGYSKWQVDKALADALKERFGTKVEVEGKAEERRDPVGLNDELAEEMSGKIIACRLSVLGKRPYILLSLLCTLASYQGMGVASQHLAWAAQLADDSKLPIWLEASPMSIPLYEKFGFVAVGEVRSDLSLGSRGAESGIYVHTCMLREPRESET